MNQFWICCGWGFAQFSARDQAKFFWRLERLTPRRMLAITLAMAGVAWALAGIAASFVLVSRLYDRVAAAYSAVALATAIEDVNNCLNTDRTLLLQTNLKAEVQLFKGNKLSAFSNFNKKERNARGASALFVTSEARPYIRVDGDIRQLEGELGGDLFRFGDHAFLLIKDRKTGVRQLVIRSDFDQPFADVDGLIERLDDMGLEILSPRDGSKRSGLVRVKIPGGRDETERVLHELFARDVVLDSRNDALRISPHFFNDESDLDRCIAEMKQVL